MRIIPVLPTHIFAFIIGSPYKVCGNFIYILNLLFVGFKKSVPWTGVYFADCVVNIPCALVGKKIIVRRLVFKCVT